MFSETGEYVVEAQAECFEGFVGVNWHPAIFDVLPEDFDQVQLGAVRRQEPKEQPLCFPDRNHRFKLGAPVNRSVINDQRGRTAQLLTEVVDTGNHHSRIDASCEHVGIKAATIVTHEAQHIELLTLAAGEFDSFANRLPAIGNAGR